MNLISKKDILAITGISYGQLYRWKRERLIPEEWFIKQSSYTGQETFFPREQILSRINSILELKDNYSLEELAKLLSPESSVAQISLKSLREVTEIVPELVDSIEEIFTKDKFDFSDIALMIAISQAATKYGMSAEQTKRLLVKSVAPAITKKNTNVLCTIFNLNEEYYTVFSLNSTPLAFDDDIDLVEHIYLSEVSDMIKMKYKNLFIK